MRYIPIIFFIFLFSFTVISCAKKSDSSSSSSASSSSASSSSEIVSVSDSGGYIQIESTNHSLDEGDVIRFTTTDTLPKGLALATDYYVVGNQLLTPSLFQRLKVVLRLSIQTEVLELTLGKLPLPLDRQETISWQLMILQMEL